MEHEVHQDELLDKADGREILDLKPKEVSMVDKPAILREFLIIKRQQEDNMGTFVPDAGTATIEELLKGLPEIDGVTWRDVAVEKQIPIDLRNAIKAVIPWLKQSAGGEGAPKDEIGRVAMFLGKVAGGQYPEPAAKAKEEEDEEEKKKRKAQEDEEEQKRQRKGTIDDPKEKDEEEKKKAKDKAKADDDDDVAKALEILKGKKGFTSERTADLTNSVKKLIGMLAQVDTEAAKGIIDDLAKGLLPADIKWTSGTTAVPASVKKELEEVIAPVAKAIGDLSQRVEAVEKTRPASKSGDGDTTDKTTVNKSDNPWEGLPLS